MLRLTVRNAMTACELKTAQLVGVQIKGPTAKFYRTSRLSGRDGELELAPDKGEAGSALMPESALFHERSSLPSTSMPRTGPSGQVDFSKFSKTYSIMSARSEIGHSLRNGFGDLLA